MKHVQNNYCVTSGRSVNVDTSHSTDWSWTQCADSGGTQVTAEEYLSKIDSGEYTVASDGSGSVSTGGGDSGGNGSGGNGSGGNGSGGNSGNDSSGGNSSGGNSTSGDSSATALPIQNQVRSNNTEDSKCVKTLFFGSQYCDEGTGDGVFRVLGIVLDVLTYGVGVLAIIGFVMVGIQYTTARDNEGQVAKAKERLTQIVIGLVIYALLYALLQFMIPGGVF